jgi:HEAT repeat protein
MLASAVADGQQAQQQAAADSLRLLSGDGVDAAIAKAMKAAAPQSRAMLIEVMADRKATAATPELLSLARDKDAGVQLAAIKALGRIAAPADLPALVAILVSADGEAAKAEAERTVVLVSRKVPDQAAQADTVLAALKSAATPAARITLLQAVGGIGGQKAFDAVKVALGDKDPAVNDAAVRALAAWPDANAVDALLDLLAKTKDNVHRVLLLRGTVRLLGLAGRPAAQTIAIYKDLLAKSESPADKKLVLGGLGAMDDPAALKVVEPMLAEPDVKGEAELAMVNIAARVMDTAGDDAAAAARKVIAQTANDGVKRQAQTILNKLNRLKKGRK